MVQNQGRIFQVGHATISAKDTKLKMLKFIKSANNYKVCNSDSK